MKRLSATELAAELGYHPATIRRWARQGLIPCERVNKRVILFDLTAVEQALKK